MSWSNRYRDCKNANSLFKGCFRGRRRRRRGIFRRDLTKPRRRRQRERQENDRFNEQNNTLNVHHAFLYTSLPSLHTVTWNDQILSLLGNGNGEAINSTISVRTWACSPLFNFSQNLLLLSNRANWDNREKVHVIDWKSVFQRRFNGRRLCRIVRSLGTLRHGELRPDEPCPSFVTLDWVVQI